MKLIAPAITLIPLIKAGHHEMDMALDMEKDMDNHMSGWMFMMDQKLEEKLGDKYTNEPGHFEINCMDMGFKVKSWHSDETGNSGFEMLTPWGYSQEQMWNQEEMCWDMKVSHGELWKFKEHWDSRAYAFKPKRSGKMKPTMKLQEGAVVKKIDTTEMKMKCQEGAWKLDQTFEMTYEYTGEEVLQLEEYEYGGIDMEALMEMDPEHRCLGWAFHQKQEGYGMEFEMNMHHEVNYDDEDMPFSSAKTCMEMEHSSMNEIGEKDQKMFAFINAMEMTSYEHDENRCSMSAKVTQHIGTTLEKADQLNFSMDLKFETTGMETCMAMMSMMMEEGSGMDMSDMPDCTFEMHFDNIQYYCPDTEEMKQLEDIASYKIISPNGENFVQVVDTYGGAPVFGLECNRETLTISGDLEEGYEKLMEVNYEQMNRHQWEVKYFFMYMFHVQMKINEMIGEWFMSEDFNMDEVHDSVFYYDYEFAMKKNSEIEMINDWRSMKCGKTIAELHAEMGITFFGAMKKCVNNKVSKELQFMNVYEAELMQMSFFSWEDHMQVMELWNSFTEEKMNKAEINQLLGETCEKHFDYMVEFHRGQAQSVTEMWQAMRDKMTMMATKVFDMVNREDEIHQKQEQYYNYVEGMAQTQWKCEFDYWLEESQGWPIGSVQDYQNCGDWSLPQIDN